MQQIQNKPALTPLPKSFELFHNDLQSVSDLDDFKYPFHEIEKIQNLTSDGPQEHPSGKLRTHSKKKLAPKYEISFEKDFMKEHKAAFQKHYQNYIESIKLQLQQKNIQSPLALFFESETQQSTQSALQILKNHQNLLSERQRDQFAKDLEHEEKFGEFLDFITDYCKANMAKGFILTAQRVWMAYVPLQNYDLKLTQVAQFGQKIAAEQIKSSLSIHFPQIAFQTPDISEQFLTIMKVFCTTALLIINGYFENPYYSEDGQLHSLKRPWNCQVFSDDEDSFESWQHSFSFKKRKLSA